MANFYEKLKLHVAETGLGNSRIARQAGIDRSQFVNILSGRRKIQYEKLLILMNCLNLTPSEKKELTELYNIIEIGEDVYKRRLIIKKLIESISFAYFADTGTAAYSKNVELIGLTNDCIQVFLGKYAVDGLIKALFESEMYNSENPTINIYSAFNSEFFSHLFSELYISEFKKLKINHLLYFVKNTNSLELCDYNLTILSNILPHVLNKSFVYDAYYYYNNHIIEKDNGLAFPYYIVFSRCVVLLSSDFGSAVMLKSEELTHYYSELFKSKISEAFRVINKFDTMINMLEHFLHNKHKNSEGRIYHLELQPCFLIQCNDSIINALLKLDIKNRDEIFKLTIERMNQLKKHKKIVNLFSKKGLELLSQQGIVCDFPTEYARECTIEERIFLFEALYENCKDENQTLRVINDINFPVSNRLFLEVSEANGITFPIFDNETISLRYIHIAENTITDAFLDFIEGMINSQYVFTKEETLEIIEGIIGELKDSL